MTKSVRMIAANIGNGQGTILVPYIFDGETLSWLARTVDNGHWVLCDLVRQRLAGDTSLAKMISLLNGLQDVGIIYDMNWYNSRLCIFKNNSGSFIPPVDCACAMEKWGCYKPYSTWRCRMV